MQLVIPMAGLGQRFRDRGYTLPKPLIPVDGVPMIARVLRGLPPASRVVCVVHPDHVNQHGIDEVLRRLVPGCDVVETPGVTAGQACSARLAVELLDPMESVCVAACDNTHLYDVDAFRTLTRDGAECVVWTYRHEPRVLVHPEAYGWVRVENGRVNAVSVKRPISRSPLEDHVVSGTFWFRSARLMAEAVDRVVASGRRVNNEVYLDAVADDLAGGGHDVRVFEVLKYIGWGTPADLDDYHLWSRYVRSLTC
jgi:NDP-sugar pyrophosphorylase family protein